MKKENAVEPEGATTMLELEQRDRLWPLEISVLDAMGNDIPILSLGVF